MPGLIVGAAIATALSTAAKALVATLKPTLGDKTPAEATLQKAFEHLGSGGLLDLANLDTVTPDLLQFLLTLVLPKDGGAPAKLTEEVLQAFIKKCSVSANGSGLIPDNRDTTKLPSSPPARNIDFLYYIKLDTFPAIEGATKEEIPDIIAGAWDRWKDVSKLDIKATQDPAKANVIVECIVLDGTGNKLAEATLGQGPDGGPRHYSMTVDSSESWTAEKLLVTLTHEFGHILGLDHDPNPNSVMAAMLDNNLIPPRDNILKFKLQLSDISAIQRLWGKRAGT